MAIWGEAIPGRARWEGERSELGARGACGTRLAPSWSRDWGWEGTRGRSLTGLNSVSSRASGRDLIWKEYLCKCNQSRLVHTGLGRALIQ